MSRARSFVLPLDPDAFFARFSVPNRSPPADSGIAFGGCIACGVKTKGTLELTMGYRRSAGPPRQREQRVLCCSSCQTQHAQWQRTKRQSTIVAGALTAAVVLGVFASLVALGWLDGILALMLLTVTLLISVVFVVPPMSAGLTRRLWSARAAKHEEAARYHTFSLDLFCDPRFGDGAEFVMVTVGNGDVGASLVSNNPHAIELEVWNELVDSARLTET